MNGQVTLLFRPLMSLIGAMLLGTAAMGQSPYCDPDYSNGCSSSGLDDVIDDVSISNYNANFNRTNSGCSSGSYEYYTTDTIELQKQLSYTLTLASGTWNEGFRAWMDFDNDTGFGDSGENLGGGIPNSAGDPYDINFTVPASAQLGHTRLRVACEFDLVPSAADSCGTLGYGEAEDYVVEIQPAPSCIPPTNLGVSSTGTNDATLNWTANNGGGNNWDIEYGPTGFTQGNGTIVNTTNNPHTLTGLNSGTVYDFYVREWCSASDSSMWNGPITFTTDCGIPGVPFYEDFNGSAFSPGDPGSIDICWSRSPNTGGDYIWKPESSGTQNSTGTGPIDDVPGGGKYMYTEGSDGSQGDHATLTSPWIDISSLSLPQFRFYYHFYGVEMDTFFVSMDEGSGWSDLDTIIGEQHSSEGAAWTQYNDYLTDAIGDTARFRFEGVQGAGYECDYSIDSVSVTEAPSCIPPTDLGVSTIGPDSAVLNWSPYVNFNGTNNTWKVEYGPSGFTQGNGTTENVTDSSLQVDNLTPGTDYDLYVREFCSASDSSAWSGPFTFTTSCAYFTAPYEENFDNDALPNCWSENVDNGSGWEYGQSGDAGWAASSTSEHTGNGGYFAFVDYSNADDYASLISPKVYVGNLTAPELSFWFFSHNTDDPGDFNTLHVEAYDGNNWVQIDEIQSGDPDWRRFKYFLTEDMTFNDTAQIRLRAEENTDITGFYNDHLIDDFLIRNAPDNNMEANKVLFPTGTHCELENAEVEARFRNVGGNVLDTFKVGYSVNGAAPVVDTLYQTLQPGDSTDHEFDPTGVMDYPQSYQLSVFSMLDADTLNSNDTILADVTVDGSAERPEPDLGPDTMVCTDEHLSLDPGYDSSWAYVWDDNSTDQTRDIVADFLDTNTTYNYTVTVTNTETMSKCSETTSIEVSVENCTRTALEEQEDGTIQFEVRPNPASERIVIESETVDAGFRYDLLDIQGRTVRREQSNGGQRSTLKVSDLSQGVYILKGYGAETDEELFQQKVVVE